mgnify:CR=1 FL=1
MATSKKSTKASQEKLTIGSTGISSTAIGISGSSRSKGEVLTNKHAENQQTCMRITPKQVMGKTANYIIEYRIDYSAHITSHTTEQ